MPDLTPRQQAEQIVDGWIRGGVIPSEQRGQYLQLIAENEKVANAFAGGFMRRSEYSTRAQEVAEMRRKAQEDIQSERLRVQSDADRLRGWQTEVEKEVNRLRTIESRVPTLEAQLAAYKQLADDHQISDRLAYKAPETPNPPNPQPNYQPLTQNPMIHQNGHGGVNPSDYLNRDEAARYIRELVTVQGQALKIAAEHQRLFGYPLEDDILSESIAANQDPRVYWESKYNVPGRRAEIDAKVRADERAKIEAEVRAQVMSEMASNPGAIVGNPAFGPAEKSLVFDTYVKDRMSQYRPTTPDGQVSPPGSPSQAAKPEQIPPMAAQYNRIMDATKEFQSNYSLDGKPLRGGNPG